VDIDRRPIVRARKGETAFINIWKLPTKGSTVDIAQIMTDLSELPQYVVLDSIVLDESQDVVYRVHDALLDDDSLKKELLARGRFAFVRHYLDRDKLGAFVFNFGALAPAWADTQKFLYAGLYQNITGLLNEFWNVLAIADEDESNLRKGLTQLANTDGPVGTAYAESIDFKRTGPDDGIVIVGRAKYWEG
jgi:hypothetical protein